MDDTPDDHIRQRVCMDAYEQLAAMRSPLRGAERMQRAMQTTDAAWRDGMSEAEWRNATLAHLTA
jgi:hypothetical protein